MKSLLAFCLLLASCQTPTSKPAEVNPPEANDAQRRLPTQPAATSQPAATAANSQLSSGDPVVDGILDRLDARGREIKGLSADLVYRHITTIPVDAEQKKFGSLLFARGEPNASFLIHFTRLVADGVVTKNEEIYAFDGRWYIERKDAESLKTVLRREICRAGERMDPFELGKGPFPLPFGQKREEILRQFEVSLSAWREGDPKDSKHLHCIPRKDSRMAEEYNRVEFYVDPILELPVKIVTERRVDEVRVEVEFNNVKLDAAPALSRFKVETPAGYRETIEPLDDKPVVDLTPEKDLPAGKRAKE